MSDHNICLRCNNDNPIGIEIRGVYDGVLIWWCPYCDAYWPRFGPFDNMRLHRTATDFIAKYYNEQEAA